MTGENDTPTGDEAVEEMDGEDVVELTDDEGNTVAFAVLLVVELEGVEYAALTPQDQLDDEDNDEQDIYLFVYESHEEDDGFVESFAPIEDEETFEKVRDFCSQQIEVLGGA